MNSCITHYKYGIAGWQSALSPLKLTNKCLQVLRHWWRGLTLVEGIVISEGAASPASQHLESISDYENKQSCSWAYPQCSSKAVLQVGGNAHEQWLTAGDHGHASSKVPHHMVSSHTHARLLWIQGKVLPYDLLTCRHGNFDRTINNRVHQLLHSTLHWLPYTLLQLGMGLK